MWKGSCGREVWRKGSWVRCELGGALDDLELGPGRRRAAGLVQGWGGMRTVDVVEGQPFVVLPVMRVVRARSAEVKGVGPVGVQREDGEEGANGDDQSASLQPADAAHRR